MRDIRKELVEMLKAEVKPAVGCTEPVALALACAKAKELLGEEIVENRMLVSPSIYKNGMCVGIPGTERLGLKIAAALGIVGGHSENGLSVLETLTKEEVKIAEDYMDNTPLSITPADTREKVFIELC
ncbi:serine dehydratase alpha chain family protein [Clostridioides difficile DA00044]|nr:serine dehydratase alpha chain family protein [Clostridioides difficile]EQG08395.1 serine dehydratase alpha chain family protein [Clostridioides difficile DA00044]